MPSAAIFGIKYQSICINVPRYLDYLFSRVRELGASILKADINTEGGIEGLVKEAKKMFFTSPENNEVAEILAVINCMGLSAKSFLPKEEAERLFPIRGQTVLVKGEAAMARTFTDFEDGDELVSLIFSGLEFKCK